MNALRKIGKSMEPHEFWQAFHPANRAVEPPYQDRYPARLPDARILFLPIRALGDTGFGIASLILNQTAFEVEDSLAEALARRIAPLRPDIVVGLPTLGLSLARAVAQRLGHPRYVALGTSRKFWYDEALSTPLRSVTSPGQEKRLYLDPRMRPLLAGRRVCLIDDVISTGTSIISGLRLLEVANVTPMAIGAAMLQTRRWTAQLDEIRPGCSDTVLGVLETPRLRMADAGWVSDD